MVTVYKNFQYLQKYSHTVPFNQSHTRRRPNDNTVRTPPAGAPEGTGHRADPLPGNPRQQDQLTNRGHTEVYCDLKTKPNQTPTEPSSTVYTQTRRKAISMTGSGCPVHATRTDHAETWDPWSRSANN